MSHNPPTGPPPPYYPGYPTVTPTPVQHIPGAFTYIPTPVMMPVYQPPPPPPEHSQPTYVTNYYYPQNPPPASHQQLPAPQPLPAPVAEDYVDWVPATPSTISSLAHKAVMAGREGWDRSPLWVIRAHHNGELVPGKLAAKHGAAYIPHSGKEIRVHNFEVLCAPAHTIRWVLSSNGHIPPGALPAGNTHNAEPLYIGRAKMMNSLTPGKVHPSHGSLYISFGGREIAYKQYEVLCKIAN